MAKAKRRPSRGKSGTGSTRGKNPVKGVWFGGNVAVAMVMKLLLMLVLLFLSRIVFFLFNLKYFSDAGFASVWPLFFSGLRFDISALIIINAPFILLMTLPFGFVYRRVYQLLTSALFYIVNGLALMLNFIDTIYFRFTLKRITADIFTYVGVGGDFDKLIPQFLKDFWSVALVWLVFLFFLIYFGRKFRAVEHGSGRTNNEFLSFALGSLIFVIVAGLSVIGIRGGLQLRPIGLVTAGNYTSGKFVPLVLNTPFSISKTIGGERLQVLTHFKSETDLAAVYTPVHKPLKKSFQPHNVVIIMLESFSREHIGSLNRYLQNGRYQGFTPFLDSLIRLGYYFDAYANGKTSIQGIPAILSGIPSLMNESFIQSVYASGKYTSIAGLMKEKGYSTAFFHGGTNGTMGFDSYSKLVGFDHYYGRTEYNNEKDYDGKWGIRDEEFLQYTANILNKTKEPFIGALFTLSSHHPYFVPGKYANVLRKGYLPIQQSIMYTDHALRQFFKTARKKHWFENTLFVITADHTSEGYYPFYQSNVGQYAIPLLFYMPEQQQMKGRSAMVVQQTDIMPTVLNFLGYGRDYLAFGSDLFDSATSAPRFSIHYISGLYGMMKDGWYIEYDGHKTTSLFDLKEDLLQKQNLAGKRPEEEKKLERFLKAYLQQYNNRLIENRLTVGGR
jgi:phosphoglycerol transferase MdoB-like AlkP superfamily enzyme